MLERAPEFERASGAGVTIGTIERREGAQLRISEFTVLLLTAEQPKLVRPRQGWGLVFFLFRFLPHVPLSLLSFPGRRKDGKRNQSGNGDQGQRQRQLQNGSPNSVSTCTRQRQDGATLGLGPVRQIARLRLETTPL